MDAGNIKRHGPYLVLCALGCVLAWKIAPLLSTPGTANRVPPASANMTPAPEAPPGSVLVNVTMVGFEPSVIEAKAGQPIQLAFFRPNANNCANEVVFPDLGIQKKLPPGQTTVVEITPPKTGSLGFECGMKMLKGKLIVR